LRRRKNLKQVGKKTKKDEEEKKGKWEEPMARVETSDPSAHDSFSPMSKLIP